MNAHAIGAALPVLFTRVSTAIGPWLVAATPRGACWLALNARDAETSVAGWMARHEPQAVLREDARALRPLAESLRAYACGELERFDVELDLRGTPFQRAVWEALRAIPYRETRTYADVARAIGRPRALRAVGGAIGRNPVPIFVPCHRVVASDGLGGFSGGLEHKRRLLALEGARLPL